MSLTCHYSDVRCGCCLREEKAKLNRDYVMNGRSGAAIFPSSLRQEIVIALRTIRMGNRL